MIDNDVDVDKQFMKFTKQQCWKHTTECVLRELKGLSNLFPQAYQRALKMSKIACKHIEGVSPAECFLDLVEKMPAQGTINNFYWICTQDEELRLKLHHIQHVPVCYLFQNNLLELVEPSKVSKRKVHDNQQDKYKPNEKEKQMIEPIKKQIKKELVEKRMLKERKLVQELAIKVKKVAKGPNPLSMKKRKRTPTEQAVRKRRHKITNRKVRKAQQVNQVE